MHGIILDAIAEFEAGNRIVAVKELSATEDYADDAFPRGGVIPNSILVEIIAQAASFLVGARHDFRIKAVPILLTTVSFNGALRPGARVTVRQQVVSLQDQAALVQAVGTYEGAKVVEAELIMGFSSHEGTWPLPVNQGLQRSLFETLLERGIGKSALDGDTFRNSPSVGSG